MSRKPPGDQGKKVLLLENVFSFGKEYTVKAENKKQRDESGNNRDDLRQEMSLNGKE